MTETEHGMADDKQLIEVRFMAPADQVAVIDAIAHASTGGDRGSVMRRLMKDAVDAEVHRATVILRVARINPLLPDSDRKGAGK